MIDAADYIPHKGPMILISEIIDPSKDSFTVRVDPKQSSLFIEPEGVPACVGIEYMAQSIAAFGNYFNQAPGLKPFLGFMANTAPVSRPILIACYNLRHHYSLCGSNSI